MGVSNPRDDSAKRNRSYAYDSAQHGHLSGWKRRSTTEPHIGFFFLHNTTEKLPLEFYYSSTIFALVRTPG